MPESEFAPRDLGEFGKPHIFLTPAKITSVAFRDIAKGLPDLIQDTDFHFKVQIVCGGATIEAAYYKDELEYAEACAQWARRCILKFQS